MFRDRTVINFNSTPALWNFLFLCVCVCGPREVNKIIRGESDSWTKVLHQKNTSVFVPVTECSVSTRRGWPFLCCHGEVCIGTEYRSCVC